LQLYQSFLDSFKVEVFKIKKMENTNNTGKMLGALLLGAAIGGALGVLFAPDKGSETRRKISAKGEDLSDAMKDSFNDLMAEVKKEIEMVKGKGKEMLDHELALPEKAKLS